MSKRKEKDYEFTEGNIIADLGLEQPEELLALSQLLTEVCKLIKSSKRTQKEIALELGFLLLVLKRSFIISLCWVVMFTFDYKSLALGQKY